MKGANYRAVPEENSLEAANDLKTGWRFTSRKDDDPEHTELEYNSLDQSLFCVALTRTYPDSLTPTELELFWKEQWAKVSISQCEKLEANTQRDKRLDLKMINSLELNDCQSVHDSISELKAVFCCYITKKRKLQ